MSELIKALVAARKEVGGAVKDKTNPAFKSKYADLGAVIDAVKEPLENHGLHFVQSIRVVEGMGPCAVTIVMHGASGQERELAPFPLIATKQDAQGHGSALTYARRYSLMTALGVSAEDDDGNAASKPALADKPAFVSPVTSALQGETFTEDQIFSIKNIANSLVDLCTLASEGEDVDYKIWELMEPLKTEERLLLWQQLQPQSAVRSKVKAICLEREREKQAHPTGLKKVVHREPA